MKRTLVFLVLMITLLAACGPSPEEIATQTASAWTETPLPTNTATVTPTFTPTSTSTPTVIPSPTPPYCMIGQDMIDVENDVDLGHVDILKVTSKIEGESLEVVFYLRELPEEITINRDEVPQGRSEYSWTVKIDVDNDMATGSNEGIEYVLQVFNFKNGGIRTGPIDKVFNASLGRYTTKNSYTSTGYATLVVDMEANTLTINTKIPGINEDSIITYSTFDINPGGQPVFDGVNCRVK